MCLAQNLYMILLSLDIHFLQHAEQLYFTRNVFFFIGGSARFDHSGMQSCIMPAHQFNTHAHTHKCTERECHIYFKKP